MDRLMYVSGILNIANSLYGILQCEFSNVSLRENRMPILMAH